MKSDSFFIKFSQKTSYLTGHPAVFVGAVGVVLLWAVTGPIFDFNETWQLVINTGTTIITFLMVFLIQSTQNRDTAAIQLKLDELIRVTDGAHNMLMDLEELGEDELNRIRDRYEEIAKAARLDLKAGKKDTSAIDVLLDDLSSSTR
ncbi:MAG: hypothetical protein DI626_03255 [Micavibrio aeruginosavorus]|uniref:Low affinity iron permease family protein n=1 Tax=Micavibrio aeruginosavorus TaxID=349221 RepID=A0A2W4ZZQ2_9BACT|nr:MAG: hypothetical protein DI626_03255 [Micavibrio aeruginosavorus]